MNVKDIIDIEAFTKGLQKTTMSIGLILPVAATRYLASQVSMMVPGGMIGTAVASSLTDILLFNVMSSH